jgi:orotate phosphoribosyltransferase
MPYSQRLARVADWFQQLWAESLGKRLRRDGREDPAGQLPVSALGATDQHSVMQLFMEGPVNRIVTFVAVDAFDRSMPIPARFPDRDAFSYLAGHTVEELMAAECRAAQVALAKAGRPNAVMSLGCVDARHLGALFYTLELQTAYAGEFYDVNAFDQPGVEAGKKYAAGLLGRSGFEDYARDVESVSPADASAVPIPLDPDAEDLLADLRSRGAVLDGHFTLRSGLHSNRYFQCAAALEDPRFAERVGRALAERFRSDSVSAVVSPALGGIVVGYETARALGVRALFTEKDEAGRLVMRRFRLEPGERVLVVEDVVTRGGRVAETLEAVRAAGGHPVGVGIILDRSAGTARFDVPTERLVRVEAEVYEPDSCPLCRKGDTAVKPGSR